MKKKNNSDEFSFDDDDLVIDDGMDDDIPLENEQEEADLETLTAENYQEFFKAHRKELNHKIVVDEDSFEKRGLKLNSVGFTEFYSSYTGLRARIKIHILYSDEFDFSDVHINVNVIAKDDEGFILAQDDHGVSTSLEFQPLADRISDASVISIFASGTIPKKLYVTPDGLPSNLASIPFEFDYDSFKKYGLTIKSYGFDYSKTVNRRQRATVFIELSRLSQESLENNQDIYLSCAFYAKDELIAVEEKLIIDSSQQYKGNVQQIQSLIRENTDVNKVKLQLNAH